MTRMAILAGLTALVAGCEDLGMMGGGSATGATTTGATATGGATDAAGTAVGAPTGDPVVATNALPAPGTPDAGLSTADDATGALTTAP